MSPDHQRALAALHAIPADLPRDSWFTALCGAKAEGVSEAEARAWSEQGESYERSAFDSTWRSIKPDGGLAGGSLYALAKTHGWFNGNGHDRESKRWATMTAADIWAAASTDAATHPYVIERRVSPNSLRCDHRDRYGDALLMPMRDLDGRLVTLQRIYPPASKQPKRNLAQHVLGDSMFVIGEPTQDSRWYVVEGLATGAAVSRADYGAVVAIAGGCGRFTTVARAIRKRWPEASVCVIADVGEIAERKAAAAAAAVRGRWISMPAELGENGDAFDYEREHGTEALADLLRDTSHDARLVENEPDALPVEPRIRVRSAADLMAQPPLVWLVKGVLPALGVAVVFGQSTAGKSFLLIDLCAALAGGDPWWFGYRLRRTCVTYCVLEGVAGIGQRLKAWSARTGRTVPDDLRFITQRLDLRLDLDEIATAISRSGGAGGLIVLDTMSHVMPGFDENSSADMTELLSYCAQLQERVGGLVLLVHHSGKDPSRGERGSSVLRPTVDASIEVVEEATGRRWIPRKAKDGRKGDGGSFELLEVEVGTDQDGDPITSAVIVPVEERAARHVPAQPQGDIQRAVYEALKKAFVSRFVSTCLGKGHSRPDQPCVLLEDVVPIAAEALTCEPKRRKPIARRAIQAMIQRGVYGFEEGWLWVR